MALRNCPVCHASVKLENLERHGANVHPRQKTLVAISADDRRVIQEKRRISTPGFHIRRSTMAIILADALMLGGIMQTYIYLLHTRGVFTCVRCRQLASTLSLRRKPRRPADFEAAGTDIR